MAQSINTTSHRPVMLLGSVNDRHKFVRRGLNIRNRQVRVGVGHRVNNLHKVNNRRLHIGVAVQGVHRMRIQNRPHTIRLRHRPTVTPRSEVLQPPTNPSPSIHQPITTNIQESTQISLLSTQIPPPNNESLSIPPHRTMSLSIDTNLRVADHAPQPPMVTKSNSVINKLEPHQPHHHHQPHQHHPLPPINVGYDVHAHTQFMRAKFLTPEYLKLFSGTVDLVPIIEEIGTKYQNMSHPALINIRNVYRSGTIVDPDLPGLNIAVVLVAVWHRVKELNDDSAFIHFKETLDEIGGTCIQGISHRLLFDYFALCN